MSRSVLVLTVVHHPEDARVRHRQIAALLAEGWQVTYAAPWRGYGLTPPDGIPGLTAVDVARARGRHRVRAQRDGRRVLRDLGPRHDVILLHDPELLPAAAGLRGLPPVVWDVHEDTAAAVEVRGWIPRPLRAVARGGVRVAELWAERHLILMLADEGYAARFRREHAVVPNTTAVDRHPVRAGRRDERGRHRVVYLGSVTMERGAPEMAVVGRELRERTDGQVVLEVLGPAHGPAEGLLRRAVGAGDLEWRGFVPNDEALRRVDGALAGLSLLHDESNFRPSMPTKIVEYLAHAVPVITTPLPAAESLVRRSRGGVVVPFGDTRQTIEQLLAWHADPREAARTGARGHRLVAAELDWAARSGDFVVALERAAASRP
ncbi:glycosyltransferase [Ornithinimicrobium cerasi]|uniref:glycosyltransferase n=1 Tax=Ornithinimicrobium cerasi TaxID=2248773 RepID=UPI000EFF4A6C|nr:glycosyltransferase [Ornithinimicrobium cerasi]